MNKIVYIFMLWLISINSMSAQEIEVKSQSIDVGQVKFDHPVSVDYELKNTCHVPKFSRPLVIGIERLVPTITDLACAGMSSEPSSVCM